MARGKKASAEAEDKSEKVTQTSDVKTPGKGKLLQLLKDKRQAREYTAETNGAVAQKIADAVANYNLDKKAFGWLSQLDRMELERAKSIYDNFLHYVEVCGLGEKLAKIQRLPLNDVEDEDGDEDTEEGNVARFPAAAGNA